MNADDVSSTQKCHTNNNTDSHAKVESSREPFSRTALPANATTGTRASGREAIERLGLSGTSPPGHRHVPATVEQNTGQPGTENRKKNHCPAVVCRRGKRTAEKTFATRVFASDGYNRMIILIETFS